MRLTPILVLLCACAVETSAIFSGDSAAVDDTGAVDVGDGSPPDTGTTDTGSPDTMPPPDTSVFDATPDAADAARDTEPPCAPTTESCNARDDDCDLAIDEAGCGCDRETFDGHTYLFCITGRSFDEATNDCALWGYHLAFIDSTEEQDFAWAGASSRLDADWWVGLSDLVVEDRYEWLDGTVVWEGGAAILYHNFRGGAPDDTAGEDCFELDGGSGMWAGASCLQSQRYVCETP